jgi:hypothetical protein
MARNVKYKLSDEREIVEVMNVQEKESLEAKVKVQGMDGNACVNSLSKPSLPFRLVDAVESNRGG